MKTARLQRIVGIENWLAIASLSLAALLVVAATSVSAAVEPLAKGTKFPLVSDQATPTLLRIEVAHFQSDHTVEVQVWLNPPTVLPASMTQLLTQVGEFCVRYFDAILLQTVPMADRNRIFTFAPLYMLPVPGAPNHFDQRGFAFQERDGKCWLGPPFPADIAVAAAAHVGQPLGSN